MPHLTVLTGDIVNSTQLEPVHLDDLMDVIRQCARDISDWRAAAPAIAYARRGGDAWQIAYESAPGQALRAALYIQSGVRASGEGLATRIAVASGPGDLDPAIDLNSAHGPVYRSSGRALETLASGTLLTHAGDASQDAAFILADHISNGWTQAQARAVQAMLPPHAGPRREAAKALGISRQAVDQALHAAGFPALIRAMKRLEDT